MQLIGLYRRESSAKSLNDDVLGLPISFMYQSLPYHTRDYYRRCTIMALKETFSNGSLGG
jgi:hypothetical protein